MATTKDVYLVVGGSGFLGRHIVEALVARGDVVSVFDVVQRYHDVQFFSGDITDEDSVAQAIHKSGATCIIHTASPSHDAKDKSIYFRVNVDGTKAVINAAVSKGVRKLVYTSSASVVFDTSELINVDERLPIPDKAIDAYNDSKAQAEKLVLAANGQGGLMTVAIRPAGIFGPGDRQIINNLVDLYHRRQMHYQIGDNNNLFDWTYVGNVAAAHLLAADKLTPPLVLDAPEALETAQTAMVSYPLLPITLTTGSRRIPTSAARPLGPCVEEPPNAEALTSAFAAPFDARTSNRPVIRSRFDPFAATTLAKYDENPLQVAGQAFFISNGEPVYFWDVPRAVWARLAAADKNPPAPRSTWHISKDIGLPLATVAEWAGLLIGKEATLTRFRVMYSCAHKWHNIEKARRVLGYEPKVGMEEGINKTVQWWLEEHPMP